MKKLLLFMFIFAALGIAQQKKIVVLGMSEKQVSELQGVSNKVRLVHVSPPRTSVDVVAIVADAPEEAAQKEKLLREVAGADAILGGPTEEIVKAAPKLKWVQVMSAGVEEYLYPAMVDSDIVLTNGKTLSAPGIADHGFAMLLALTRKLTHFITIKTEESWDRSNYHLLELEGATALVIGTGGIGSCVARRAKGFGMHVIGIDPREFPPRPDFDEMYYPDRLNRVLPRAGVIFLCAPHTPESENMLGPKQFNLMKKGAFFIGLSRGKVYHLDSLVKALDSKQLAGAGVDVTEPEPLPKGHPLWKFDNVVVTPHIATQTQGGTPRRIALIKDNIERFANGEPLRNVVDKQKGY